jgi:hypothetical protein
MSLILSALSIFFLKKKKKDAATIGAKKNI